MKSGRIILAELPQSDGKTKLSPALVIKVMPPFNDFLVRGISSQLHQSVVGFDEIIDYNDNDFKESGLVQKSLIRLGYLAIIPINIVVGSIGNVSLARLSNLKQKISSFILKD